MDPSIDRIRASDGSGNANVATIQNSRAPLSSTIVVDTVVGIPDTFMGSMGTPHTFTDPITSETITVISEETAVDFAGHVDGSNLEIDEIAPGYTDEGSKVNDIVIIRPTTQYADNVADVLDVSLDDDGTMKLTGIQEGLGTTKGVFGGLHIYTSSDTWTKPTGLKFAEVFVIGGGGGSGGCSGTTGVGASAGGGGGGYSYKKIAVGDLGATEAVTVGAAGAAGASGNNPGGTGGTSSFGSHASATGGAGGGGSAGTTGDDIIVGGAGGVGSSGSVNIGGGGGTGSFVIGGVRVPAGTGGSSVLGGGGSSGGTTPVAGSVYGGGAGGGSRTGGGSSKAGAAGGAGIVIVREYY